METISHFEIGKTYYLDFANGDRSYFTVMGRYNNQNWHGVRFDRYRNSKPHKPKQTTVFHPLIDGWKEAPCF
jgi:hypothetical protein